MAMTKSNTTQYNTSTGIGSVLITPATTATTVAGNWNIQSNLVGWPTISTTSASTINVPLTGLSHPRCLNLLELDIADELLAFYGVSFLKNAAMSCANNRDIDYPLTYDNYHCFIEQDFSSLNRNVSNIHAIKNSAFRFGVLAIDTKCNRLEFVSIIPQSDPTAGLDALLSDNLTIKADKTEFIASLYGRHCPFVRVEPRSITSDSTLKIGNSTVSFESSYRSGIVPTVHLSNLIFGELIPADKKDVGAVLENLTTEVLVLQKEKFPKIQKYFSPEYGYLSLREDIEIKSLVRKCDNYTKIGLISLLADICVPNSNIEPFVSELLASMSLDQRILNIEDYAMVIIKSLIERNID